MARTPRYREILDYHCDTGTLWSGDPEIKVTLISTHYSTDRMFIDHLDQNIFEVYSLLINTDNNASQFNAVLQKDRHGCLILNQFVDKILLESRFISHYRSP